MVVVAVLFCAGLMIFLPQIYHSNDSVVYRNSQIEKNINPPKNEIVTPSTIQTHSKAISKSLKKPITTQLSEVKSNSVRASSEKTNVHQVSTKTVIKQSVLDNNKHVKVGSSGLLVTQRNASESKNKKVNTEVKITVSQPKNIEKSTVVVSRKAEQVIKSKKAVKKVTVQVLPKKKIPEKRVVKKVLLQPVKIQKVKSHQIEEKPLNILNQAINVAKLDPVMGLKKNKNEMKSSIIQLKHKSYAFQKKLPKMSINVHMYDQVPQDRFVMINMSRYEEGDLLEGSVLIKEIIPKGVVMMFENEVFMLKR